MILQDIKRSGYEGMLPAGIVLTGGSSQIRGIGRVAQQIFGVPARVAKPKKLVGLVDALHSPAFATGVGLLEWAVSGQSIYRPRPAPRSLWPEQSAEYSARSCPAN